MTIFKTSWEELRWLSNHISSILGGYSILLSKIWRLVIIKCWSYQANLDRVRSSRSQMHFQGRPKSASKSQSNVIMSRKARKCKPERKKCSLNVQGTFQDQENISRYSMKFRLHLGANVGGIINPRLIQSQNGDFIFMITLLLGHVKMGRSRIAACQRKAPEGRW